ncbi:adenylate/guanylate cyclase domain-containing protein [Sinorhizobium sp. BG8]|uniref:ATP-binding protein n=1 Tax=Sinorhizobium sp. BG8 TaxID=2613773 RepID=UPI00193DB85C|nr:adenylate/guanylate cyclase domain-containing protein [Sinorhizobium sp. BG8]QRM53246.1 AAA family ATPase [Sinorhizobium sp. BG8]
MKSLNTQMRLAGERRQVTALFYDIVGSTEILVRGDPEQFFRSVTALHHTAEAIVARRGGFLHKRLGDGGCCYFGYPKQAEDAAENAVEAALELIQSTSKRNRKSEETLRLRIGIATGLVVFSSETDEIVGTAPILASRLQAEAEPNSVLVADSTFELTRGKFEYSRVGEAKLKGFGSNVTLWRPESKLRGPGPVRLARNDGQAMMGRDEELATLVDAWNAARGKTGGSFAIVGEAGIGKSRLVAELRRSIDGSGLSFQCNKRFEGQPFHPFIGFLETMVEERVLKGGSGGPLREALQAAGMEIDAEAAEIIGAFTAERSGATAGNILVADLTGRAFRGQVIDAAVRLLCSAASSGPVLIVFEDVHWADEMTLELLDSLCALAVTLPILVIQTSRVARVEANATRLALTGLPAAAIRDLVTSIWDGPPPAGLSDFILDRCDGMPLYAEELAHFFRAKHASGQPVSEWKELLLEGGVSSLNDLLSSRLAGAGAARRVAQFASVIGREFTIGLLANLLDGADRSGLDLDLKVLTSHGIIEPSSTQSDTYQFRHVLLQEAAYSSLLKSDRRKIHMRIAKLLVEKFVPPLPDAIAAWQCAEAGRHDDAARFALTAAEACVLRSAMKEAAISLDLCNREVASLSRRHPDRPELILGMLQLQGVVATALEGEGSERARRTYSRAMQLVRRHQTATREAHFPTYWGWWFTAPDIRTQQSRARILVEDMMTVNNPETRLQSYHCAWATGFHAGEHGFCLDCVEKGLELYDADRAVRNRAFFGGHDAKVCGLGESALSHLIIDQADASEKAISLSLEYATSLDHVGSLVHALYYAIVLRRCQGKYEDVHALGEQMLSLAERHGLVASQARANLYCGWAEAMADSIDCGTRRFDEGLALQKQIGTDENLSIHIDMQSQILERSGRPRQALALIDDAIAGGRKSGQRFWLAELYRRRAALRQLLGARPAEVKADLKRAVQTAEAQGALWLAGRARHDLQHHIR